MAVAASKDEHLLSEQLINKNEGDFEHLLSQLGKELGVDPSTGEGGLLTHDSEGLDKVMDNEENVFKLLQSLDSAGKIMDLIDKKADNLLAKMDQIILDLDAEDPNETVPEKLE